MLPEFWSSTSWIALPPSSCLIWESDHVILKSSRKVAGRASTDTEYNRTQKKREATEFLKEGHIIVAIGVAGRELILKLIWKKRL